MTFAKGPDPVMARETRDEYRSYCSTEKGIPFFSQPWVLDSIAPDRWAAAMARDKSGAVVGTLPYTYRRKYGKWISTTPNLIPRLGPWIPGGVPLADDGRAIARHHKVMDQLAESLPTFDHFAQNWNPGVGDWLPFYWRGYTATTHYTYQRMMTDPAALWNGVDGSVRTEVRKARDRFGLHVDMNGDLGRFLRLNQLVFERQGLPVPYTTSQVAAFDSACSQARNRLIVLVHDSAGQDHAGCYIAWDGSSAYYLLGGSNPVLRSSGAGYFALWSALSHLSGQTEVFDFEGSMLRPVERVFRAFGSTQVPYQSISRTRSRAIRVAAAARSR